MTERIAIVGSRAHPNLELVRAYVRSLPAETVVISGGAKGVDTAARKAAAEVRLRVDEWLPHGGEHVAVRMWNEDGECGREYFEHVRGGTAYYSRRDMLLYRNTRIAVLCDRMVVFPDGSKGGCWDAAREARRFRRPVEVRYASGRVIQAWNDATLVPPR